MSRHDELANNIKQLELLHESIADEIDELQSLFENSDDYLLKRKKDTFNKLMKNIISNLESSNDAIYTAFEEMNSISGRDMFDKAEVMAEILDEKLTYDEKLYIKLKHGIELGGVY